MCDTTVFVSNRRVLFSKNSDRDHHEVQVLDWQPAKKHQEKTLKCTWIEVEQIKDTHAILLSRPSWMWGAEIGANEHGVVIGNEAVFTKASVPEIGLTGMDMLRLALERSHSAAHAIEVLIDLLERYPQGGRCSQFQPRFRYFSSFLVADKSEAYVFETCGKDWASEKIESGSRTISNGLTIKSFADKHSDFIKTFVSASKVRQKTSTSKLCYDNSLRGAFQLLSSHRNSEDVPNSSWARGTLDSLCMHGGGKIASSRTTASWVSESTPDLQRVWVTGTPVPCLSLFKPVSIVEPSKAIVDAGEKLWRDHDLLVSMLQEAPTKLVDEYRIQKNALQEMWLKDTPSTQEAIEASMALTTTWNQRLKSANIA